MANERSHETHNPLEGLGVHLGTELNECSIIAADLASRAHDEVGLRHRILHLVADDVEPHTVTARETPLTPVFKTDSGYPVQLSLVTHPGSDEGSKQVFLSAIVRGNVEVPMASFQRDIGCHYVKFGDSLNRSDMVVTGDDEPRRLEQLQAVSNLFEAADPTAIKRVEHVFQARLRHDLQQTVSKHVRAHNSVEVEKYGLGNRKMRFTTEAAEYFYAALWAELMSMEWAQLEEPLVKGSEATIFGRTGSLSKKDRGIFDDKVNVVNTFFSEAALPFLSIRVEEEVPGSKYEPVRTLLLNRAARRVMEGCIEFCPALEDEYQHASHPDLAAFANRDAREEAVRVLQLDERLHSQFGEFSSFTEDIMRHVGNIAVKRPFGASTVMERVPIGSLSARAVASVRATPLSPHETSLDISAYPLGMGAENTVSIVRGAIIDKSSNAKLERQLPDYALEIIKGVVTKPSTE